MLMTNRYVAAFVVFAATICIHGFNLGHASYFLDEAIHLWNAQTTWQHVIERSANDPNPPLYNLIMFGWIKLFGISEVATRSFSLLMMAIAAGSLYLLAEKSFGRKVAAIASLFFILSPIQYHYSHLARPYSFMMVFTVLSYSALLRTIDKRNVPSVLAYFFFTTLMMFAHPTSIFSLAAQGLIILINAHKNGMRSVGLPISGLLASALTFGLYYLSISYFDEDRPLWFGPPTLENVQEVIVKLYSSVTLIYVQLALLLGLLLRWLGKSMGVKNLSFVLIWVIVPVVGSIVFSHTIKPLFQPQYILAVQPAMMLLLAISIEHVLNRKLLIAAVVVIAGVLGSAVHWKPIPPMDWKNAVSAIMKTDMTETSVMVSPGYELPTMAFYFDRSVFKDFEHTDRQMEALGVYMDVNEKYALDTSKYSKMHVLLSHEGFMPYTPGLKKIFETASLISTESFKGIRLLTFDLLTPSKKIAYDLADFTHPFEINDSSVVVNSMTMMKEKQYSFAAGIMIDPPENGAIQLVPSINSRSDSELNKLWMVLIVSKDDEMISYKTFDVRDTSRADVWVKTQGYQIVTDLEGPHKFSAYLWNYGENRADLDSLTLTVY
ncbi:MAG: hypothetical protein ACI85F_002512 [Bacteroidia bacterium]|jgi:hypothetical protein